MHCRMSRTPGIRLQINKLHYRKGDDSRWLGPVKSLQRTQYFLNKRESAWEILPLALKRQLGTFGKDHLAGNSIRPTGAENSPWLTTTRKWEPPSYHCKQLNSTDYMNTFERGKHKSAYTHFQPRGDPEQRTCLHCAQTFDLWDKNGYSLSHYICDNLLHSNRETNVVSILKPSPTRPQLALLNWLPIGPWH